MTLSLVIGNKNYSSWSLRPWLVLKQLSTDFEEIRVPLYTPQTAALLKRYSPSGRVPVLIDNNRVVWDSLAICEYLAESHPDKYLWPRNRDARAMARAISAELHSGFSSLREHMCLNIRRVPSIREYSGEVGKDITRIVSIWNECRDRYYEQGPYLFGHFTIADAMYAPVALRFTSYLVTLDSVCSAYATTVQNLPAMREWVDAAHRETEVIPQYEF